VVKNLNNPQKHTKNRFPKGDVSSKAEAEKEVNDGRSLNRGFASNTKTVGLNLLIGVLKTALHPLDWSELDNAATELEKAANEL